MTDTAEDIVRALAANEPIETQDIGAFDHGCLMCSICWDRDEPKPEHDSDCIWRRAVEWVEANPK